MSAEMIFLALAYRPPFEWGTMVAYLAARAIPGVEAITPNGAGQYWRSIQLQGHQGYIAIGPDAPASLQLGFSDTLLPVLTSLLARVRRLLDLDADPLTIGAHLTLDPELAPLVARRPGLRVPGSVDGFELALRAVLGQQVTVRGGSTLAGRLAGLLAEPFLMTLPNGTVSVPIRWLPLSAERLADASVSSLTRIGLPRARAQCIWSLARAVAGGELPELVSDAPGIDPAGTSQRLRAIPGIGAWTASYILMRALRWPDAFPEGDLGLRRAAGGLSPAGLLAASDRWRPWRAYAAQHLWASLGDRARDASHQLQEPRP